MSAQVDEAAERAVLGGVLISQAVLRALTEEGLRTEHFWREGHRAIFSAMLVLSEQGDPVDGLTVLAQLERTGQTATAGGLGAVDALGAAVPDVSNVRMYARRVVELAGWRRMMLAGITLQNAAEAEDELLVAKAEALLAPDAQRDAAAPITEEIYAYLEGKQGKSWPFPYRRLNDLSNGGMYPAETTFVSAWTATGKSIMVDQVLQHVAGRGGRCRLYINEGSRVQRALRMIARDKGIPYSKLRTRALSVEEHGAVVDALRCGLAVEIVQAANWSAGDIARDMRWNPRDVVAVDILHEIAYADERELSANWSTLKAAGVTTGCHLIVTGHLNEARSVGGEPPAPTLRDIRGSGMLKNGSDNTVFIHREHVTTDGIAEMTLEGAVWFAKSRSGDLGGVKVHLDPKRMRFLQREATV